MSDQKIETEKTIKKKTFKKAAPAKNTAQKEAPVKKVASSKKKLTVKSSSQTTQIETSIVPAIQAIVEQMNKERESRDKQISSLIQEVRMGFDTLSDKTNEQSKQHEKEMTGLYQSLQNTFGNIKDNSNKSEDRNLTIFKSLSDSIMKDHEQTLMEVHEQEKLQDMKIKHIDKIQQQRSGRNRLIAIPGMVIAIISILYMFNVVNIMESAMTSISQDMHKIQLSVGGMTEKVETISLETSNMNSNMQQLNGNMNQMSKDLNVMTNNVAPAMKGMRNVMPWAP